MGQKWGQNEVKIGGFEGLQINAFLPRIYLMQRTEAMELKRLRICFLSDWEDNI